MTLAKALAPLLYSAVAEPIGLLLQASDPARLRQQLYAARAVLADPALAELQFRIWPGQEANLALVKSTIQLGQRPSETPNHV